MRVLIATLARPHPGGLATYANGIARALRSRGHVALIGSLFGIGREFPAGPRAVRHSDRALAGRPILSWASYLAARTALGLRHGPEILAGQYGLVHAVDAGAAAALAPYARLAGRPLVLTALAILSKDLASKGKVKAGDWAFRRFEGEERRVCTRASAVLVQSRYMLEELASIAPAARPAVLAASLVGLDGFRPAPELRASVRRELDLERSFVVLCPGRLHERKGVRLPLRALAELKARNVGEARLLYAGDGPEAEALRGLAAMLEVEDSVDFLGACAYERMNGLYNAADAVVVASVTHGGMAEPGPLTLVEAMAAGRAVVASRMGGIVDHVEEGVTGLLFPEGDVAALAAALQRLREDLTLRERLGGAARERVAVKFGDEAVAKELEAIYRSAGCS